MTDQPRVMPDMLSDVRDLPYGTYHVRVVHQHKRDAAFGLQGEQVDYLMDNMPHVLLHLGLRWYVLDTAQQFHIGSVRGGPPAMFDYYRMIVEKPDRPTGIIEDVTRQTAVRYEHLGKESPGKLGLQES
jgi:hypothetical protein